jgi:DNA-binding winged helix-turn-helix (wHTH) protein/Tfp pilus assembly protein PilF
MALETRSPAILRFGTFEVNLRAGELRKQGVRIKLQEQPFHVLTVLLQRPGDVVTREELRSQNWPADTFVDFDNSLNTAINKLREALGDSADNPRFIETLPRRGYRFIAPVTGVDGTPRGAATGVSAAAPTRSRKMLVTVAVLVLAAGIAEGLLWRARQARRLTEKDTIVLGDFANTTGDAVFDDTLKQGLRVQLEQSPFLNILSDEKAGEELQLMGRTKDDRLTNDLARDLCQRVGSKAILTGTISSLGTHYVIGLNAMNCKTGDALASEQVEADSREHVLKALGETATRMRKRLGESLTSVQKYDAPVEATTASLEALKAYSLGMKTWFAKGDTASLPFFKRAVELDAKFAMAYARLAMVYDNLGENALTTENMHKAYELREKVSEWERLYLEAHYYDRATGELEKAAQVYEVWQQTYPRDWVPYNNLRGLYAVFGKYEKALEEGREAVRLEPGNEDNYFGLGHTYIALNRLDEAAAVFKQAEERKLEGEGLLWGRYLLAFLKDDAREIERLVSSAAGNPGSEDDLLIWEGLGDGHHGKLREARELWQRVSESAEHDKATERAALFQACTGFLEAYLGDSGNALVHAEAAAKLGVNRDTQILATRALALAGDVKRAEKLATELNKRFPLDTGVQRYWLPTIRAAVALDRKNAKEAVEMLRVVSPYELGSIGWLEPVYVRGQAYLMLQNGSAAAAEFQKILDRRRIVQLNPVGVLAQLGLARSYALQGDTAKARAAYNDFLTLWKDADPDIPVFKAAKAEYAKLQ